MRQDIQNVMFSVDAFEKKYRKRRDREIKKIILGNVNMEILNLAPPIKRKYEIASQYLKEYQDALGKNTKKT
jgi:hypothetical protein